MIVNGERYTAMPWLEYEAKLDALSVDIKVILELFKDGKGNMFLARKLSGLVKAMEIFDIRDREPCLDEPIRRARSYIAASLGEERKLAKLLLSFVDEGG